MAVLPSALTRNWTLKLASLGLAVFLWAVVRAEPTGRETLAEVPVRVQVGDLDWTLAEAPEPTTVEVRFAGPVQEILRLSRTGTSVRIPVDRVASEDTVVQLRRDWVVLDGAAGLVVDDIVPSTVRLRLARNVTEPRPVAVRTRGQLPAGLGLAAPLSTSPQVVRLRGPEPEVAAVDSVPTVSLDLGRLGSSGLLQLPVDTSGMGGLVVNPLEVQLRVQVDSVAERVFDEVPVNLPPDAPSDLLVEPGWVAVRLVGPRSLLMRQSADSIELRLRLGPEGPPGPGEARRVSVDVVTSPGMIRTVPRPDSVTVRRPGGDEGAGGRPG